VSAFTDRIRNFFAGKSASPELFEDLADLLVEGDFGAAEAYNASSELREQCKREGVREPEALREKLALLLESKLVPHEKTLPGGLSVILLLGVNGVGKTTTAAKLAAYYRDTEKRRPILAAADTFRAAAIDQLKIHGERLGVRVVAHKHGGDPAAVVYDAVEAASSGGGDLVIADTAGRMHTKSALVEELRKIERVVESRGGVSSVKLLVLDATTGRNAIAQAEVFHEAVSLSGCVLTKYDSGAKGGAVFSLSTGLKLPVAFLCDGETYTDIRVFDPRAYAREFAGLSA
jgi:fused signal recognition particle receptor